MCKDVNPREGVGMFRITIVDFLGGGGQVSQFL